MSSIYSALVEDNPAYSDPAVQQGLEGLDYLTGVKHKEVNTFADDHPAQAVLQDAASYGPVAGLTIGGGLGLYNAYRKMKDSDRAEEGFAKTLQGLSGNADAGLKNSELGSLLNDDNIDNLGQARQRLDVLHTHTPDPNSHGSISALIDVVDNKQKALAYLTHIFDTGTAPQHLANQHGNLDTSKLNAVLDAAHFTSATRQNISRELAALVNNGKFVGTAGGLPPDLAAEIVRHIVSGQKTINDNLVAHPAHTALGAVDNYLSLGKGSLQTPAPSFIGSSEDIKDVVKHRVAEGLTLAELNSGSPNPLAPELKNLLFPRGAPIAAEGLPSTLGKWLPYLKVPAITGASLAVGGYGLSKLLGLMHEKMYGSEKMKEYKRNLLMAKGQANEATQQQ